jgi:hypothetical protein
MLLHLASFGESKRPRLLKQAGWKADFANVVHETAEMSKPLVSFIES